jgi:hypothetical protein
MACRMACRMARALTVAFIMGDPTTPQWIKQGVMKLRRDNPLLAAFLEALHDIKAVTRAHPRVRD